MADKNDATFSRKDRIQQLAEIEADITGSLHSAAKAIKALSGQAFGDAEPGTAEKEKQVRNLTADEARSLFEQHTSQYMNHVQAVNARLKRQIYALEEAGIIPPTAKDEETQAPQVRQRLQGTSLAVTAPQKEEVLAPITNGGLGNFDVGWLNSRRDLVGKQKEAELWAEAKAHLERLRQERKDQSKVTT